MTEEEMIAATFWRNDRTRTLDNRNLRWGISKFLITPPEVVDGNEVFDDSHVRDFARMVKGCSQYRLNNELR